MRLTMMEERDGIRVLFLVPLRNGRWDRSTGPGVGRGRPSGEVRSKDASAMVGMLRDSHGCLFVPLEGVGLIFVSSGDLIGMSGAPGIGSASCGALTLTSARRIVGRRWSGVTGHCRIGFRGKFGKFRSKIFAKLFPPPVLTTLLFRLRCAQELFILFCNGKDFAITAIIDVAANHCQDDTH